MFGKRGEGGRGPANFDQGGGAPPRAAGGVPVFGHVGELRRDPLGFLRSLPAQGDVVEVGLGPVKAFVVCEPGLVRELLLDDRTFDKGGRFYEKGRQVVGDGLATCTHDRHRRQRRLLQPVFHPGRLPGYARVMTEQAQVVAGSWSDGLVIDVDAQMRKLATATVVRTLFTPHAGVAAETLTAVTHDLLRGLDWRLRNPVRALERLPTPANRRFRRAKEQMRKAVEQAVAAYRRLGADEGDALWVLLQGSGDEGLDAGEIHDQVLTLLIGATETTTDTLAWALYLLARHPGLQQRLHEECVAVTGGERPPWFEDLPQLGFAEQFLTETQRLHPAVWVVTRRARRSAILGPYALPQGATIIFSPYLVHTRADLYPRPEVFDPGRWADRPVRPSVDGTYLPFGAGPRKCIGDRFAMTEMTLALAQIAQQWTLEPLDQAPVQPRARVALTPHGLRLRVRSRT